MSVDDTITRGVAWLDEHKPDWLDHVDERRLDMSDPCGCLFGHVYAEEADAIASSGFHYGVLLLDADTYPDELAFECVAGEDGEYEALTAAWVARIEQLRAERGSS